MEYFIAQNLNNDSVLLDIKMAFCKSLTVLSSGVFGQNDGQNDGQNYFHGQNDLVDGIFLLLLSAKFLLSAIRASPLSAYQSIFFLFSVE